MSKPIKIVGLGGALANTSTSLFALKIALESAASAGAEIELFDLMEMQLPLYDLTSDVIPEAAQRFCDATESAQGMIWASPLYHGTVSGVFKNALDWLELLGKKEFPYLTNKVVGLISTAGGTQGLQAINTMEFIVRSLRGWTVPLTVPIANTWEVFDKAGNLNNEKVRQQLDQLGKEVVICAQRFA